MTYTTFRKTIWQHYRAHGRHDLPWRKTSDPYRILVSEIMLQQTQVSRVETKYKSFIKKFPTVRALASASLRDVLIEWQGLGYNRRAKFLKQCAQKVVEDFNRTFPHDFKTLCSLPGIGPATAGDIMAFAYNMPVPVIETNIRSVYIHFFFKNVTSVSDRDILPLIEKTLDRENPREWYWALFDYGAYLKTSRTNPSRRSAHHNTQSRFAGSNRQKRAHILRLILEKPQTAKGLVQTTKYPAETVTEIIKKLIEEDMIQKKGREYIVI